MSISILNRGASGGLKPELTVIAPAGSTIDIMQGGIILDTYTLGASETEHTFIVRVGTYTVRGTLGEQTKSEEVLIDAVGQYAVEIWYSLWLYDHGDECEDLTGGWTAVGVRFSSASTNTAVVPTVTRNADSIVGYMGTFGGGGIIRCNNTIDLSNVNTLYFTGTFKLLDTTAVNRLQLCVWSSIGTLWQDNIVARLTADSAPSTQTFDNAEIDVSELSGEYVIGLGLYGEDGTGSGESVKVTMNELRMK